MMKEFLKFAIKEKYKQLEARIAALEVHK